MLIGTAGHIDHGKTTLLRALTGVDTDRLPEEKRRGISIELGYAYLPLPDAGGTAEPVIGFVDVPGHEKFVPTMLAGASGIDFALLVVAADDGPMPQTREHLQILDLLGVRRGCIALTRIDRVSAEQQAQAASAVRALLAPTTLAGSPLFPVSAPTDTGIAALRQHLFAEARRPAPLRRHGHFRLAVDRAFSIPGAGTVVTGTVHAGTITAGEPVRIAPGTATARVRGLHAQNRAAGSGSAGQRCAINLAGIGLDTVRRGDWLVAASGGTATQRFDIHLRLAAGGPPMLADGASVQVHHGARHVSGRLALLDDALSRSGLPAGTDALAQIVCDAPLAVCRGDLVVVRAAHGGSTLGGGPVLDAFGPVRHRRSPARQAWLAAQRLDDDAARLAALIAAAPLGIDAAQLAANENLPLERLLDRLPAATVQVDPAAGWLIGRAALAALATAASDRLTAYHAQFPDELGLERNRLLRMIAPGVPARALTGWLDHWRAAGVLARSGNAWHLPGHCVELSAADQRRAERLLPWLADNAFDPPWVRDLAARLGEVEDHTRSLMKRLAARGDLFQVVRDLFYTPTAVAELATIATELGQAGPIRAGEFRDRTGLGRKRAIQILEFFDRVGYTRRVGHGGTQAHVLRGDAPVTLH